MPKSAPNVEVYGKVREIVVSADLEGGSAPKLDVIESIAVYYTKMGYSYIDIGSSAREQVAVERLYTYLATFVPTQCSHKAWYATDFCGEMTCPNYVNKHR